MLGIADAEHEETAPHAPTLLIRRMASSLAGKTLPIRIVPGSAAHRAYGCGQAVEQFACSFGVDPAFRGRLEDGRLKITGEDGAGRAMVAELVGHPFYIATLFVPQASSQPGHPHPLIVAAVEAATKRGRGK